MPTQQGIPYPGPAFRPAVIPSVASQQARLETSPNACQVQWWLAIPNPLYTPSDISQQQYTRELQSGNFFAVVSGMSMLQKYFPNGTWESSDIMVSYDSSVFGLSQWDHIMLGTTDQDMRRYRQKNVMQRGATVTLGPGGITASGTAVVGSGTTFTSLDPGNILSIAGEVAVIASIANDTHMTLVGALAGSYEAISYNVLTDVLLYWPATKIVDIRSSTHVYVIGTEVALNADSMTIDWLTPGNAPTGPFSVTYDYYPTFEITDFATRGPVIKGLPVLDVIGAKLWKPQTIQL